MRDGDRFCADCGAPAATPMVCTNGHPMAPTDGFCEECGQPPRASTPPPPPVEAASPPPSPPVEAASPPPPPPVEAAPPPPVQATPPPPSPVEPIAPATSAQPTAPPVTTAAAPVASAAVADQDVDAPRRRRIWPLVVIFVAAVAVGAIATALLLDRNDDKPAQTVSVRDSSTSTTTRPVTNTTRPLAPDTTQATSLESVVRQVDVILVGSAASRGKLSDALDALASCDDPAPVAAQILEIEGARTTEIAQVSALDPQDADAQAMVSDLLDALTNSRDSDSTYAALVSGMDHCAPLGANATAAEQTDQAASAAKRRFVAAYNPVAATYGLKADWTEDQI